MSSPSKNWGRFWGGFAGFTSFVSHTGGPPFQIYVLPQKLSPALYSGTSAFFFAIVNSSKLVPYYFLGQLSVSNLELAALLAPVAIAGVLLGVYLVRRISARFFYQIAYGLVFLLALKLIYDGATGLMA
ncbi:MAG: sulfite exporter TauE/SafE family protein [Devosia nanyangense]|nr:sulfite exporter TauE/SafE family protein [Devosia nanyangense]